MTDVAKTVDENDRMNYDCQVCDEPVVYPPWEDGKTSRTSLCRHSVQPRSDAMKELGWEGIAGSIIDTVSMTAEDYVNEKVVAQLKRYFAPASRLTAVEEPATASRIPEALPLEESKPIQPPTDSEDNAARAKRGEKHYRTWNGDDIGQCILCERGNGDSIHSFRTDVQERGETGKATTGDLKTVAHDLWNQGGRLRTNLDCSMKLNPENWHIEGLQQRIDEWDEAANAYFDLCLSAPTSTVQGQGEVPHIDRCEYCGTTATDHKHGNGHRCCGDCCAAHGYLADDKGSYNFVERIVAYKNEIADELLSNLRKLDEVVKENERLTSQSLYARRSFHNLQRCNQFFERCENPVCQPLAPLACIDSSSQPLEVPGDRAKIERILDLESKLDEAGREIASAKLIFDWILGSGEDFPVRPAGKGLYWWRDELSQRIKLANLRGE